MKRFVFAVCFVLVCFGVYENNQNVASFERDLVVWVSENELNVLAEVNPMFEETYNVTVKLEVVASDEVYSKLFATSKEAYPDVINVDHVMISDFVEQQLIAPVNTLVETLDVLEMAKKGLKVRGDYFGVPYQAMTDILYYDTSKFSEGISSFQEISYDEDVSITLDYKDIFHVNPFLTGFGGYIVGVNNFGDTNFYDIGLNSQESIDGFMQMIQMLNKNVVYENEGDVYQTFIDQEADFLIASASMLQSLQDRVESLGYQAIPNFVEEILPYTYMYMQTYQMTSLSEQVDLATEYLKFLVSDTVAIKRYNEYDAIAPLDYTEPIATDEYYTVVKKQLHRAIALPNQSEFNQLYVPYQKALDQLVNMPDQIQSILDEAVNTINADVEMLLQ